ncbi:ACP S-malonyltransferase [Mycobacteroides abscessus]|uniref:ACP S-malonyltransferase n=1 Tax=Mycobacteroides abscessus TaxID=36809 RepID=UPI000C268D1C|nr:ACP S-malonyltransferase [Mycobacteroides abscessus]
MRIAFVFPGQGSQVPGMGTDLYQKYEIARKRFDEASEVLGYDLLLACRNEQGELEHTRVVQPGVLVHSVVCWELVKPMLRQPPIAMAGHSLGEISALVCAGSLDFQAAVRLVDIRAKLMSEFSGGAVLVVLGLDEPEVSRVCEQVTRPGHLVTVANRNSTDQFVLSGHEAAIADAGRLLDERGGVTARLAVSVPVHSPLMEPITEHMSVAIRQEEPRDCVVPVLSSISGTWASLAADVVAMLDNQLTGCVDWPLAMARLVDAAVDTVIELGPKTVLRDLCRANFDQLESLTCGTVEELAGIGEVLRRSDAVLDKAQLERAEKFLLDCLCLIVGTPSIRQVSAATFESAVRVPYESMVADLDHLRKSRGISPAALRRAAQRTNNVLRTKGFSDDECQAFIKQMVLNNSLSDAVAGYVA